MTNDDNTAAKGSGDDETDIRALRLSILHSPIASAMLDRDLRYLAVSPAWRDNFGLGDREIVGRAHRDVLPELADAWHDVYRRSLAGEPCLREELRRRADGTEQWLHWQVRPWHRADERIGGIFLFAVDITATELETRALGQRERLFEALFEEGPVGVAVLAPGGRFRHVNEALQRMLGYTEAEMRGRHFSEFTHPDDIASSIERVRELTSGGRSRLDIEKRYLHKNGSVVYANTIVTRVRNELGEVEAALAIIRDITEQKRAEQALHDSELRFQTLFAEAPIGIATMDAGDHYLLVNKALQDLLGYDASEMRGRHFSAFTHPDDLEACRQQVARMNAGDAPRFDVEKRYIHKSGRAVYVNSIVTQIRDKASGMELRLVIAKDITEQKRTEQALREREQLFRTLFEQAPIGIFLADAEHNYLHANKALQQMLGYSEAEIVGGKYTKFTHPDDREASNRLAAAVLRGEREWTNLDKRYIRKDGSILHANTTLTTVRSDGGTPEYYLAMAVDIGERRKIEEAMERNLRLEAIAEVAGTIAHDFNNLLAVVIGSLELAEPSIGDRATHDHVARALQAARAGASFNRRLLPLTNQGARHPVDLDIDERVANLIDLLRSTLGEAIAVDARLSGRPWPTRVDPGELDSAVINLCLNARDAMPEGGKLTISTENVAVAAGDPALPADAVPGDYIMLCVEDAGVGMAADVLRRACQPFFTTKPEGEGTGLGLTSVDRFARQAGGFLTIDSTPGAGTTVCLYLPRAGSRSSRPPQPPAPADTPVGNGELVLVVEDDAELREVTLQRLERLGYAVLGAADVAAAKRLLAAGEPVDLVLSDIVMGGGETGYDLARWIAANRPATDVVLCSAHPDARAGGAPGDPDWPLLAKPIAFEQLARVVRAALDGGAITAD